MILLIDNYDSFVYNLYQFIAETGQEVRIVRNDEMTSEEVMEMRTDAVVISPGPGKPGDAGICVELIQRAEGRIPVLGVCLGHQAIAEAYGAEVVHAGKLMHGKTSVLRDVQDSVLFRDIPGPIQVARYHSLAVREETLPEEIRVTARAEDGEVMAMEHRRYDVYGVQFHPESVMTPQGYKMIENFIRSVTAQAKA
ncbi:aminodeoxychorismate/anthranilate synthase component II [Mediterraneibacter glycyrrhizinilyticus]|nr:aminodeoxychorismate/anthranilate synthase component II [Mediterraneibacter glycyrrhizinilyticus]MBM6853990.1 aminodeoxychorismate/anthranilate synthase component II [Mediterraneibacter glycyrrhizinilyticus]